MDLNKFLGEPIIPTLSSLKAEFPIVEYSKVEGDEFIKLPEQGFYLHAPNDKSIITGYRLYLEPYGEYFSLDSNVVSKYRYIETVNDMINLIGQPVKANPTIKIPGMEKTLPGYLFIDSNLKVTVYYNVQNKVQYINVKRIVNEQA